MSKDCPYPDCEWPHWSWKCKIHTDEKYQVWIKASEIIGQQEKRIATLEAGKKDAERFLETCEENYRCCIAELNAAQRRIAELEAELNTTMGAMQELLMILKGNKTVHSTLMKEVLNAARALKAKADA